MPKVIVGMTISLDGFAADQNGNAGRLFPDLAALRHTPYMHDAITQTGAVLMGRRTFEMADPDSYVAKYEFQVPIFVLTHHPPSVAPKQDEHLTFTFITGGVKSAVGRAKAAAQAADDKDVFRRGGSQTRPLRDMGDKGDKRGKGEKSDKDDQGGKGNKRNKADKVVQVVGGVNVARQLLAANLADELHIEIMPIFLGSGLCAFASPTLARLRLEKIKLQEVGPRTSTRLRVKQ
jgi:dihydrofolate reductase